MVANFVVEHLVSSLHLLVVEEASTEATLVFEEGQLLADPILLVFKVTEELTNALLTGEAFTPVGHRSLEFGEANANLLVDLLEFVFAVGILLLELFGMGLGKK